jgi:hypothetical protein
MSHVYDLREYRERKRKNPKRPVTNCKSVTFDQFMTFKAEGIAGDPAQANTKPLTPEEIATAAKAATPAGS